MTIQNFYPVFENGQVLTSASLNDIVDYLEPQDRLTRSRLIGIGIACGLTLDWNGGELKIGKGVAVTSEGFLIAEAAVTLNRARPYLVPQPDAATATDEEKAEARYPFLFDGATPRQAFELLPTSFIPAPGEVAPLALTETFMADKTVLLFLERNRAALKNCDVNDCSDKGSEMSVTLRRLLVSRATADKILTHEAALTGRNVDRANHPRLVLAPLPMEKLNPAGAAALDYPTLTARQVQLASVQIAGLVEAGRAAFDAYRSSLEPLWPPSAFPNGPLPPHHVLPLFCNWAAMPVLGQYLYAAAADLTLALNEFLAAAARYDAECSPDEARFPRHMLLGDPLARPRAFADAPRTVAEVAGFDAGKLAGGPGPEMPPAPRRHHFVPSPAIGGGAGEMQALFHRFVLIAQSFDPRGLVGAPLLITPSRDGQAPLGDRAIPAWLAFDTAGDLFANWSWTRALAGQRPTIQAYALTATAKDHPLSFRRDGDDFLRVEGVVGRPLGSAIAAIVGQKRALGLSFGIAPVYLGTGGEDDPAGREAAAAVMRRILLCQMRELDVMFLTLMAGLFAFMVFIVRTLGPVDATRATKKTAAAPAAPGIAGFAALADTRLAFTSGLRLAPITLDLAAERQLNVVSDLTLERLRGTATFDPRLVRDLAVADAGVEVKPTAVAELFDRTRDRTAGGELIDRVHIAVKAADPTADPDVAYPAVALMARAEEMMSAASAHSVTEFDQPRFTTAMRGLADAYAAYADRAETDPAKAGADTAAANQAIIDNRDTMAAAAAQLGGQAITAELEKMLQRLFGKQTLEAYAREHPGLEHKGGVPVGGTLVLLYLHRSVLDEGTPVEQALKLAFPAYSGVFRKLTGQAPPDPDLAAALEALRKTSVPGSDDALDQFVVVGDLCLPTLCCDAECAEGEIFDRIAGGKPVPPVARVAAPTAPVAPAPQPAPEPVPAAPVAPAPLPAAEPERVEPESPRPTLRGGVLAGSVVVRRGLIESAGAGASLAVRNLADGTVATHPVDADGSFKLPVPAGKYELVASIRGRPSEPVTVAVRAGATATAKLVIPG